MQDLSNIKTHSDYFHKFFYARDKDGKRTDIDKDISDGRFVGKLYTPEGEFLESILIPSEKYPLNDSQFSMFHKDNCKEVTDKAILDCFNAISYRSGFCYSMADELSKLLNEHGIKHSMWCGWFFVYAKTPLHHCWITVGDNDDSVLDLQDDFSYMFQTTNIKENMAEDDVRQKLSNHYIRRLKGEVANTTACQTVGVPSPIIWYVGSRISSGESGKAIYNNLIRKFPEHPCNQRLQNGMTKGQQILYNEKGGMRYIKK